MGGPYLIHGRCDFLIFWGGTVDENQVVLNRVTLSWAVERSDNSRITLLKRIYDHFDFTYYYRTICHEEKKGTKSNRLFTCLFVCFAPIFTFTSSTLFYCVKNINCANKKGLKRFQGGSYPSITTLYGILYFFCNSFLFRLLGTVILLMVVVRSYRIMMRKYPCCYYCHHRHHLLSFQ